jgi:hypothetical protein
MTTPLVPPVGPRPDPAATAHRSLDLTALRARISGRIVLPDDADWDTVRAAWHLLVDQRPAAVILAASVEDIVEVVRFAAEHHVRIAPQTTGHGAQSMEGLDGAILLRTGAVGHVEVDAVARRARVQCGARWQDLVPLAAAHGLAALHGSAPDIGIVGYTLGGGLGWFGRRYGLACNSVLAVELVTFDGIRRRVDASNDPELFWALRGGGGSFGIVTALEFALYPVDEVHAGVLFFPLDRGREVLHAWRDWSEQLPDTVTSVGRLLRFPLLPELPAQLRGGSFAVVEACMLEPEPVADRLLEPLRALGTQIDTFESSPLTRLPELHMDPPTPVPAIVDHRLLDATPAAAIDAIVDAAGPSVDSPLLSVELRHLGGALSVAAPEHGVLARLDAGYALAAVGMPIDVVHARAIEVHLASLMASAAPWSNGREYLNFAERATTPDRLFGAACAERLARIAATVDPFELAIANHRVLARSGASTPGSRYPTAH